jgi:SAM-dependent methyltransferase
MNVSAAMRASESDDEVRQNIPPTLIALFNRVRTQIRGSKRQTRTEAFLEYVADHPGEELDAVDRIAEWKLKQVLRPMLDFYETPSWAVRALLPAIPSLDGKRVLDPGCGTGAILRELGAAFPECDITGLEKDRARFDHATTSTELPLVHGDFFNHVEKYDAIVSNPPYSHALEFVQHALTLAPLVCMLLRLPWLASQRRADWHRENPSLVCVLPKRPSFTADGKTDATEYAWFVWGTGREDANRWSILHIDLADTKKRRR